MSGFIQTGGGMGPERIELSAKERERLKVYSPLVSVPRWRPKHLARRGTTVSRETLRKWVSAAGLWRPRNRRLKTVHVWRPRRSPQSALFQPAIGRAAHHNQLAKGVRHDGLVLMENSDR
jgi:hypothetical protein